MFFKQSLRLATAALLLATDLLLTSCGPPAVDETNLEKVATYYYQPGRKSLPAEERYRFLSTKAKERLSLAEFKRLVGANKNQDISVSVLGEMEMRGQKYRVVSITESVGKLIKVSSVTWISEEGKWRRLLLPQFAREVTEALRLGDYAALKAKAEEWLLADPFAVDAYVALARGIRRSDSVSFKRGDRSQDDIVRALLGINPDDTRGLECAVLCSDDLAIAKTFLKKMQGTISYSTAAFNVVQLIKNPQKQLEFLDGMELTAGVGMQKLRALATLERWDEFRSFGAGEGSYERISKALELSDPGFSAAWAGTLGYCFYLAEDKVTARKYLELGVARDPNQEALKKLARSLEDH